MYYAKEAYKGHQELYISTLNEQLSNLDAELVLYDETEYFQDYLSPIFNYPYIPRKNIIENFHLNFDHLINGKPKYEFHKSHLKLSKSITCLEEPIFN